MIILIDGYNLLHHIFPGKKHALDKHKQLLIKHLGLYKHCKTSINEVILVFDGGLSNHAMRTVKEGIVILEAGTKSSADDWIIGFSMRNKGKEILLVTLDRALRESVEKLGADWLSVFDFYKLMQSVIAGMDNQQVVAIESDIIVYKHDSLGDDMESLGINKHVLDMLMEQASVAIQNKLDRDTSVVRKGKGYTPSKIEKRIAAKIKKLG